MGLKSKGEGLWLTDSILLIRDMHGVTESTSLNWLFGVSCMLLMLSYCIWGGSDSAAEMMSFLKLLHYTIRTRTLRYALQSREIYTEELITSPEILSEPPPQTQLCESCLDKWELRCA